MGEAREKLGKNANMQRAQPIKQRSRCGCNCQEITAA
jgi:hypothetical protein